MAGFLHDICMVVRRRKLLVGLRILRVIAHGTRPQVESSTGVTQSSLCDSFRWQGGYYLCNRS